MKFYAKVFAAAALCVWCGPAQQALAQDTGPLLPHAGGQVTTAFSNRFGPDAESTVTFNSVSPELISLNYTSTRGLMVARNLQGDDRRNSSVYVLGYAQLEYQANDIVTVFGRLEGGIDQDDSVYLGLLETFITERYMLGARWDVAKYHSLTFEIADTTRGAEPGGSRDYNEYRLQWSAVFP